jgi:hypothetical protein
MTGAGAFRLGILWTLASVLAAAGTADASTILNVAGSTGGCFGTGCTTFTTTVQSTPLYDLTFTGSTFAVQTDLTGSATNFVLGTLDRGNTRTPDSTAPLPFTLEVIFTLPTGINGGQIDTFTALIQGSSASGGGGPMPVDFDNSWFYFSFVNAFGSGGFEFSVLNDPSLNKNNQGQILGGIRNAVFTPIGVQPPAGSVPEPSTLLLMGVGAAVFARSRRRRNGPRP